jgi:hypothetical protein
VTYDRICKDCIAAWWAEHPMGLTADMPRKWRPAPHPGPRCTTHHRLWVKRGKEQSHRRRTVSQYGLAPGEYDALLAIQGGVCYGCGRSSKSGKRLAVDHDHRCCSGHSSCGKCVRGLLCHRCNDTLAHFRDNPKMLRALATYLESPPAWQLPGHERYRHA